MPTPPNWKLPEGFIEVPPHSEKEIPDKDGGIFLILRNEISRAKTGLYIGYCNDKLWSSGQDRLVSEQDSKTGATHVAYKAIKRQNESIAAYSVRIQQEFLELRLSIGPSIKIE